MAAKPDDTEDKNMPGRGQKVEEKVSDEETGRSKCHMAADIENVTSAAIMLM